MNYTILYSKPYLLHAENNISLSSFLPYKKSQLRNMSSVLQIVAEHASGARRHRWPLQAGEGRRKRGKKKKRGKKEKRKKEGGKRRRRKREKKKKKREREREKSELINRVWNIDQCFALEQKKPRKMKLKHCISLQILHSN